MQTKRKRKQWALLAFIMIATFVLQLITPLTVNAEEQKYFSNNYITTEYKQISRDGTSSYWEYSYKCSISSNKPYKLVAIEDWTEHGEDGYDMDTGIMYLFEDIDNISFIRTVLCEDNCAKKHNCTHASSVRTYTEDDFEKYYDTEGNFLCYGLKRRVNSYFYDTEDNSYWEYNYNILTLNDACFTYKTTIEQLGFTHEDYPLLSDIGYEKCVQAIYEGKISTNGQFDESTAVYDTNVPTPNITVKNDYSFGFNNACDNYYFQIKGRWYSVDDIELYKKNLQWLYKYESVIKSNLTDWVTTSEKASTSMQDLNLATFGKSAFDSFLSYYPIESRSYTGGTNAIGNYFNGYNDALSQIKMLLSQPTTFYNGLEIYIRYYTFDENGIARYGKWCHYYDDLANQDGSNGVIDDYIHNDNKDLHNGYQSEFGVTDDGLSELENSTNSKNDIDIKPEEDNRYDNQIVGVEDLDLSNLISSLGSLKSQSTALIDMFVSVFSFLPSWLITLIACSFGLCCVLGVWKMIRG